MVGAVDRRRNHHPSPLFEMPMIPRKGKIGIRVGGNGEEQQRFEVRVEYLSHRLFSSLLREVEEEFGFDHDGPIRLSCGVDRFRRVLVVIAGDCADDRWRRCQHRRFSYFTGCFGV
ncbi:auxin-responsive protein SAUR32-like [Dioscorea cayenensis subsp. rotundata]|uniref:Auxin-responsive protein SAUR32-like n=1 Tax=Dioscorea cayennensis subsp. rotundata TaxID=55577 RepID=A0AB40BZ01_DIOCR|nr:auxin-responsive protein SAUR32-like [Dioscorea cayenensis subsp. rotundata]